MVSIAVISKLNEQVMAKLVFQQITANLWNAIVGTDELYQLPITVARQRKMFLFDAQRRSRAAVDQSISNFQSKNNFYIC